MTGTNRTLTSKERLRELRKTVEHYARTERDRASDETVAELFEVAALLQSLESSDETPVHPFSTCYSLCEKHKGMSWSSMASVSYSPPPKLVCPICEPPPTIPALKAQIRPGVMERLKTLEAPAEKANVRAPEVCGCPYGQCNCNDGSENGGNGS